MKATGRIESIEAPSPARGHGPDSPESLQRRLDWRFLLPSPSLHDVAYTGPDGPLLEALGAAGGGHRLDPNAESAHDLVVASQVDWPGLQTAWTRVAPGGYLYLEMDRRQKEHVRPSWLRGFRGLRPRFDSLGIRDATTSLHWPDFASCKSMIPLQRPEALRFALEQRFGDAGSLLPTNLTAALALRLPPPLWAPCFSLLARKPHPTRSPASPGIASRLRRWIPSPYRTGQDSLQVSLLTPRFRASRHIVFLAFGTRASGPLVVAKTPRRLGDDEALRREARMLQRLQEACPDSFSSIPRVLSLEDYFGRPLLIESALRGPLLSPARIGTQQDRYCRLVTKWLIQFHSTTRGPLPRPPEAILQSELRTIAQMLPGHDLLKPSVRRLAELPPGLPAVCEHGDLSHPNLVELEGGEIGVLDWEAALFPGLPATDLFFFLAFVARTSPARHPSKQPLEACLQRAFGPDGGWAIPYLATYARKLQIERGWLPALFVACWLRAVGRLAAALPDSDTSRNWLAGHPYLQAWRFALKWEGY